MRCKTYKKLNLKGQCHEIFRFWFFSSISFPPAPEYPIRTVSKFFENSRRYWEWEKSSIRKILIILLGHLWIVELTHIYIFAFKFTLRYLQPDINPIVCHRCRWYRWQFAAGIVDTGGKFATGINNTSKTGGKICRRRRWYRWSTLSYEYLREFSKKCETALMVYSGV